MDSGGMDVCIFGEGGTHTVEECPAETGQIDVRGSTITARWKEKSPSLMLNCTQT